MKISKMRLERIKRGMSQVELWHRTGIPQWRLSLVERGIPPTEVETHRIAAALGVAADELFQRTAENRPRSDSGVRGLEQW